MAATEVWPWVDIRSGRCRTAGRGLCPRPPLSSDETALRLSTMQPKAGLHLLETPLNVIDRLAEQSLPSDLKDNLPGGLGIQLHPGS